MSAAPAALVTEHLQRDAVLITGCSSGIGEATALLLARGGMLVFANVRRAEDGEALAREAGDNLRPLVFDVSDADGIERARAAVAAEPGIVLRAVVNNAGIGSAGPLEILPLDEIRKLMEINYIAPLAVTKAFLPLLHESRGRLINVTSIAGKFAAPFGGAYAASKFAYEAASDALRLELAPFGIRVIVVEPGADQTDARMGHHALLLSDRAEADAKPELEIYADDVACAHGNTVGALDEEALFYAASRGIGAQEARAMLIEAFVGEVIDRVGHAGARDRLRRLAGEHLGARS